jgi:transcriptional regulator with XRE-family HTH domain
MCEDLNLSKNIVSDWKSGRLRPSLEAVLNIADYFGVNVDSLLGLDGRKKEIYRFVSGDKVIVVDEKDYKSIEMFLDIIRSYKSP